MTEPTSRQKAGYLRRLLRRGEIVVIDPRSGAPLAAAVELEGEVVQLLPALVGSQVSADPEQAGWSLVLERLRKTLSLAEAEELAGAVEAERARAGADQGEPARPYIPEST
jgi:hypothetical protein